MIKLFKALLFIAAFNIIIVFGFITWGFSNAIGPSMEDAGVTIADFFKKEIDPEKYQKLEQSLYVRSKALGKQSAQKVGKVLEKLFVPNYDFSNMEAVEYPYPSLDEVIEMNNAKAQKGLEQALKNLEEAEKVYQAIREETLSTTED